MSWKLADLFVEFSTKGAAGVQKDIDTVKAGIASVASVAQTGFAIATASLGGWVAAGLAGTVQADQLSMATQQLAREIAAVFSPAVQYAVDLLKDIVDWFRSLSGEQQDNIMKWTLWSIGALGVATALYKIGPAIVTVTGFLWKQFVAMQALNAASGDWLKLAAGIAIAGAGIAAVASMSGDEKKKKAAGHRIVERSGGAMESITSTYSRIQVAASKTGNERDYAKETAEHTAEIKSSTEQQIPYLGRIEKKVQPAMGK